MVRLDCCAFFTYVLVWEMPVSLFFLFIKHSSRQPVLTYTYPALLSYPRLNPSQPHSPVYLLLCALFSSVNPESSPFSSITVGTLSIAFASNLTGLPRPIFQILPLNPGESKLVHTNSISQFSSFTELPHPIKPAKTLVVSHQT